MLFKEANLYMKNMEINLNTKPQLFHLEILNIEAKCNLFIGRINLAMRLKLWKAQLKGHNQS